MKIKSFFLLAGCFLFLTPLDFAAENAEKTLSPFCNLIGAYGSVSYPALRAKLCKEGSVVLKEACALGDFYWNKNPDTFLSSIQTNGFWERVYSTEWGDRACNLSAENILKGKGFIFSLLDVLKELVWAENVKALKVFVKLAQTADGEAGEYYDEIIARLLDQKMAFLLQQWSEVKPALSRYHLETTGTQQKQVDLWKTRLDKFCSAENQSLSCKGLKEYLATIQISLRN